MIVEHAGQAVFLEIGFARYGVEADLVRFEDGTEAIVILLGDGIVLVVVALGQFMVRPTKALAVCSMVESSQVVRLKR